jgi:hypothetical protein
MLAMGYAVGAYLPVSLLYHQVVDSIHLPPGTGDTDWLWQSVMT